MTSKTITGIVSWLRGWFYTKDEIVQKEGALQTQINNKASQSDFNTLSSNVANKLDASDYVVDNSLSDSSTNPVQNKVINTALSNKASQSDLNTTNSNVSSLQTSLNGKVNTSDVASSVASGNNNPVSSDAVYTAINNAVSGMGVDVVDIVNALPTGSNIDANKIYLILENGEYNAYVRNNDNTDWVQLDDFSIDLSDYSTTQEMNTAIDNKIKYVSENIIGVILGDSEDSSEAHILNVNPYRGDFDLWDGEIITVYGDGLSVVGKTHLRVSDSNTSAVPIVFNGVTITDLSQYWGNNCLTFLYWDGAYYILGDNFATTTRYGITKLQDTINSSTTTAVTPNAVNTALNNKADSTHSHGQITNDGKITSTAVTIASGDNILITDASDSSIVKRVATILSTHMKHSSALANIGTSANATQSTINTNINTKLGSKAEKSEVIDWDTLTFVAKADDETGAITFDYLE